MGHPEGYTSYDHGAFIREGRRVGREMFSEMKLQSRWLTASKGYLSAVPQPATHAFMDTAEIITTPVLGNKTRFYITRHADSTSEEDTKYRLPVPTMYANLTIPLLGGDLILRGRDSKIHVTHYDVGGIDLVCSSAEIYTWKKYKERKRVLILYGSEGESHEFALPGSLGEPMVQGTHVNVCNKSGLVIVNRQVQPSRRVVEFNGLTVFLLWRNQACNYRVLGLPDAETGTIPFVETESSLIINGGYLSRNATLNHDRLHLTGDINATTEFEVIGGVSTDVSVFFNGKKLNTTKQSERLKTVAKFHKPILRLPDLSTLPWMKLDSVPELSDTSSDRDWTKASLDKTANTSSNWSTPTSLFSGDYGYHSGSLLFRGHFTASGNETDFNITMQGGAAPGSSVWLGDVFLGSFYGDAHAANQIMFLSLPALESGHGYVLTILMDNMGYDMNFYVESDAMKAPRGGLAYSLSGHDDADITWKITSNLGGEDYLDKVRGPYNEGAMYAERKRFHLPSALMNAFEHGSPYDGLNSAGVAFYTTTFGLQTPDGFDIPLSFVFDPSGQAEGFNYRVQLFVNGYQFGKYGMLHAPRKSDA